MNPQEQPVGMLDGVSFIRSIFASNPRQPAPPALLRQASRRFLIITTAHVQRNLFLGAAAFVFSKTIALSSGKRLPQIPRGPPNDPIILLSNAGENKLNRTGSREGIPEKQPHRNSRAEPRRLPTTCLMSVDHTLGKSQSGRFAVDRENR